MLVMRARSGGRLCWASLWLATFSSASNVAKSALSAEVFWTHAHQRGLRMLVCEESGGAKAVHDNATVPWATLTADVCYGRPVVRVPTFATIRYPDVNDDGIRGELAQQLLAKSDRLSALGDDGEQFVGLACSLLIEKRNNSSPFKDWLDKVWGDSHSVRVVLTDKQQMALAGTTAQGWISAVNEAADVILQAVASIEDWGASLVDRDQAIWALGVVLQHARPVGSQAVSGNQVHTWRLLPLVALCSVPVHPDDTLAIPLQDGNTAQGEPIVQMLARRDMQKHEAVVAWAGRLSNSDMILRHGFTVQHNPIGIGGKRSLPSNWSPNRNTPNFQTFAKFNCTSPQAFEMRFSPRGWPVRTFVRCFRVAWLLSHGWYSPECVQKIPLLDKWPPPPKYNHSDWLAWTQMDQELNTQLLAYCQGMKKQLKETLGAAVADYFRSSSDVTDKLLWALRNEESKTFKECISLARSLTNEAASAR